jgi:uncharacterized SAM-binding protein YcdF (DUF218 family)
MTRLLRWLLLPPGCFLWLLILAWWLFPRRPKWARRLVLVNVVLLYALSTGPVSQALLNGLDVAPPLTPERARQAGAQVIVCLGAGGNDFQPELGFGGLSSEGLDRTYYAVFLHGCTGLPIVFSGGGWEGHAMADHMRLAALQMGVAPEFLEAEGESHNTWENAQKTQAWLQRGGRRRILLVTDRWHMRRALYCFQHTDLQVVPAPYGCDLPTPLDRGLIQLLPTRPGLAGSTRVLEEWLGNVFYRLRYR